MGVLDVVKAGVLYGEDVEKLYLYAKENGFAIPAVNVVGTNSINAVLEAAKSVNSPVIIQFSNGGASFYAGKGCGGDTAVIGAISGAKHASEENFKICGKPLFSSHMLDLSEENLDENLNTCESYLKRMSAVGISLEIELGVTGGEEDGVDNTNVDNAKLYTQPIDVASAYERLSAISPNFSIAASFGNVHGVYKPGNVILRPEILRNSQEFVANKFGLGKKPIKFVFHGGSGSELKDIKDGVREYEAKNHAYLQGQIGNPEGDDKPNKKYYDPRKWLRQGEESVIKRLKIAFEALNCVNKN